VRSIGTSYSLRVILTVVCTITLSHVLYGSLYCIPEQRPSTEVDLARLMLLVNVLFDVALEMIVLPEIMCLFREFFGKHHLGVSVDTFFGHFARPHEYASACRSRKWYD